MTQDWPAALGEPVARAVIRSCPGDFVVTEIPGFELSGDGEHVFLWLEKRGLNTADLVRRLARLAGVQRRDVGYSGLKDRNALTRQWFSVSLGARAEPDWSELESMANIRVIDTGRHRRKLRRGTHRGNRFTLRLRELEGDRAQLERRLQELRERGAPNYFGEQRFGRDGATMQQARRWVSEGGKVSRERRGLYFSALRGWLFNRLLAQRVRAGDWDRVRPGDVCMLAGSRSFFACGQVDTDIESRAAAGDLHPGLPLWGRGADLSCFELPADDRLLCAFLEDRGLEVAWRPTRLLPDDFCWQFCDDDSLQLDFALGAGSYATALLAEFVRYTQGSLQEGGTGGEQG